MPPARRESAWGFRHRRFPQAFAVEGSIDEQIDGVGQRAVDRGLVPAISGIEPGDAWSISDVTHAEQLVFFARENRGGEELSVEVGDEALG